MFVFQPFIHYLFYILTNNISLQIWNCKVYSTIFVEQLANNIKLIIMNIDKIEKELTKPIFDHINSLTLEQLTKQRNDLMKDMELIESSDFKGNKHDLYRIRNIELSYINYKLS